MLSDEKKTKKSSVLILFVFSPQMKGKPQTIISPAFVGLGADMSWINQDTNMSWEV